VVLIPWPGLRVGGIKKQQSFISRIAINPSGAVSPKAVPNYFVKWMDWLLSKAIGSKKDSGRKAPSGADTIASFVKNRN